ncbi:MAG: helix-turn-helix domain-containing protein [Chloracidobacterium sp.]|nr:helix-turn-helix domain-containing protein [Chloracidobacterium sp.]
MIVQKAFKYRFFSTDAQSAPLARTFGCARYDYNLASEYLATAWQRQKETAGYDDTTAITKWKKEHERTIHSEVSPVILQQSLRNLDNVLTDFFEYKTFKSRRARQSVRYASTCKKDRITLARRSEATSDGEKLKNPRFVKDRANRKRVRFKVAKPHARFSDTQRGALQKFMIREIQAISVEGLNVAGMVQNHHLTNMSGIRPLSGSSVNSNIEPPGAAISSSDRQSFVRRADICWMKRRCSARKWGCSVCAVHTGIGICAVKIPSERVKTCWSV